MEQVLKRTISRDVVGPKGYRICYAVAVDESVKIILDYVKTQVFVVA
jgi:hypothetical protein